MPISVGESKIIPLVQLDPVPATQRNVPAGGSVAFDFTLRLAAVLDEFDFSCVMKLYDADLNQLDVKQFDLLTGIASVGLFTVTKRKLNCSTTRTHGIPLTLVFNEKQCEVIKHRVVNINAPDTISRICQAR